MTIRRVFLGLLVLLLALAALRVANLLAHQPLLALANSFDQARYTGCFDLYPDRAAPIRPDENSPQAPFEYYRYQQNPVALCYASSELLFQAAANGIYHLEETAASTTRHSVRWIGALRGLAWLLLGIVLCRAWWRRGLPQAALANALLFAALLADPANTLYFNTYYAEPTALMAAWLCFNVCLLQWEEQASAAAALLLAAAGFLLATSKIQHLLLPIMLSTTLLLFGFIHKRTWHWTGKALLVGATLGALLQFSQLGRTDPMMLAIRSFNRADVIFTGLLPAVDNPSATLQRLGVSGECAVHAGKAAWQLPGLAEDICPGIEKLGRLDLLLAFAREPESLLRFATAGVMALDPWLPRNLGHVEGTIMGALPASFFSLSRPLAAHAWLRYSVFALPLLGSLLVLLRRQRGRFALYTLMTGVLMLATFGITLLGDGLADVAKQGHLIFNASLAWSLVAALGLLIALGGRIARRGEPAPAHAHGGKK
ncbi:MAG: hypothetical protein ABI411_17535 [Tahibacter sp.]